MSRKSISVFLSIFIIIAAVLAFGYFTWFNDIGQKNNDSYNSPVNAHKTEVQVPEVKYKLTVYDGKIAVYVPDNPEKPHYLTTIDVRSLTDFDRKTLENGIPVYSDEELTSLLEDYGS